MTSVVALAKPGREANTELIKMFSKWVISNNFFKKRAIFGVLSMKYPESYFKFVGIKRRN